MDYNRPININITTLAVIKIFLVFIMFYFLYLVREVLAILFISLILSSALDPWVDWMQGKKIPRAMGVLFIYLAMFLVVATVIYLIIPPIVTQVSELTENFPAILEKVISGFEVLRSYSAEHGLLDNVKENVGTISSNIRSAAGGIFSTVTGIFGGIFTFFLVMVITFYMVVEENAVKKIVWSIAPKQHQVYVMQLINRMQKKIGLWLRGQLILSVIIFALTFTALTTIDLFTGQMEYALVLALLAGLTEFVPYLGPILAAIPAVFLALTVSPTLAIVVALVYYVIQLMENNIIVPKLMQKVVGLNPIVSIAVILIGFKIAGVPGAILSIPVATAVSVFIRDIFERNVQEQERGENK
ncbi:AI-2E family transporter [Candidatus Parcubacteria bacterium]|nr:AI-2E family transporter [Candidatus Parcubacteria bacterium]